MFTKIAYQCLAVSQDNRPSMENVMKELEEALLFQETHKANLQISLEDIRIATQNFNNKNIIKEDSHYKMYKGEVSHANGHTIIEVKRLNPSSEYMVDVFSAELKVLMEHKHENLIGFVGYCDEFDEKIIVWEQGSLGSLDNYLDNVGLTWRNRLKICVDIASGLEFLHGGSATKEVVIHRNIKSENIKLDGDLQAKIVDFGFSVTRSLNQEMVLYTSHIKGTDYYVDPQYEKKGMLSKECDLYSMGVVLFEIMSGKLVYSEEILKYKVALGPLVRRWHEEEKLDEMVFKDTKEHIAPESLAAFQRIVIQCLHDKREDRPTAGDVVMQLKKALEIQEKSMDIVRISFEDIKLATDNFSDEKCLGSGGSGKVYIGQLQHANGQKIIAAKRMDSAREFYEELEILSEFRHKNVIGLEGCCDEMGEKIIVYEYQSKGSLDRWLNDISFSWVQRLSICIDIASGLNFLHGGALKQALIHKDIRSSNILLSGDWKAKISQFGLSSVSPVNQLLESANDVGTLGYRDPQYASMGFLTKQSDIYSLGVILFEILCGRLTMEYSYDNNLGLVPLVKSHYDEGKLDEMVFEGIRKQILPESLITFAKVAYQCLHDNREERPTAYEVMRQLEQALESQEDCEKWEPKLPSDYKEIIDMSKTPEKYYTMKKKDLFDMLISRGIYIQEDKVWFWLDKNGRRNKSISPTLFSHENRGPLKWRHRQKSSFKSTSMMLDASNLQIRIQINAQLLSPGVMYAVHLAFKFGDKKKTQDGLMYVNLKYKKGNETLHAYFANLQDNGWMSISLYQFMNEKEDNEFEVLLESFSRYYCGTGAVYIDAIDLYAIENVEAEEIEELKEDQQVLRPNLSMGQVRNLSTNNEEILDRFEKHNEGEKLFELSEVNGKIIYMLSAKEVLYDSSNVKLYNSKRSEQSRFLNVFEVLPQQVLRIKCKIGKQRLSPNTFYECYLVFKILEKCRGLHCPVKIRDILRKNGKQYRYRYFRSPAPWNLLSTTSVPKQREDGWMEVRLLLINTNEDLKNEHFPVNLKLISFEGTMSGLIVEGLEFRPEEN